MSSTTMRASASTSSASSSRLRHRGPATSSSSSSAYRRRRIVAAAFANLSGFDRRASTTATGSASTATATATTTRGRGGRVTARASRSDDDDDDKEEKNVMDAAAEVEKAPFATRVDDAAVERALNEILVDTSSSPLRELFSVEALRDAEESGTRLERVIGAEFVPQAIIEAERKASPLRRPRLVVYALSASAAAAQAVSIGLAPESFESPVASALSDFCVIVLGSLLWRVELQQRAETLKLIWAKAKEREESLTRAEAGMGDTIWTAMKRKNMKKKSSREEDRVMRDEDEDALDEEEDA
jgi:hypothetical protein